MPTSGFVLSRPFRGWAAAVAPEAAIMILPRIIMIPRASVKAAPARIMCIDAVSPTSCKPMALLEDVWTMIGKRFDKVAPQVCAADIKDQQLDVTQSAA